MPPRLTLKARLIIPTDAPPVHDGLLTLCDGRVERIAPAGSQPATRDLGNVAIIPRLVNAHTHLEFSDLHQPLAVGAETFADWIRAVLDARQHGHRGADPIELGLRESKLAGVGYIGEIATSPEIPSSLRRSSIAGTRFFELIGASAQRAQDCLSVAADYLAGSQRLPSHWRAGLSPHAPYTTSLELVRDAVELARKFDAPLAMHLAETKEELELLRRHSGPLRDLLEERDVWNASAFPPGTRPLDYLKLLSRAPQAVIVHGNYLADDELAYLAEHDNMSLVYCPRSHAFFGHAGYPLRKALDLGVRVRIGTDSRASNPDLSLWNELQVVAQTFESVSQAELMQMATATLGDAFAPDMVLAVGAPAAYALVPFDGERDQLMAGSCRG